MLLPKDLKSSTPRPFCSVRAAAEKHTCLINRSLCYKRINPDNKNDSPISDAIINTSYPVMIAILAIQKNLEDAKAERLALFSEELDNEHEWELQDIYEQIRKIICKYE